MKAGEIRIFRDRLAAALVVELVCSDVLPAEYRRDIFRQEMRTADSATAEHVMERVMGRLDDADPLAAAMGWA